MALVEMCVAVALSGFLVLLLSGMLSQTLVISTVSQNELIAAHAAEELLENARVMTYDEISSLTSPTGSTIPLNQPVSFVVNQDGTATPPSLRRAPVQLDLTDNNVVYGEVNPLTSPIVDASRKWVPGNGNYFRGYATEVVSPQSDGNVNWYEITVTVSYDDGNGSSITNSKKLIRKACVVSQGLNLRQ